MIGTYVNRIDKLEKITWSQFSTKVSQKTLLGINDWDRMNVNKQIKFIIRTEFTFA